MFEFFFKYPLAAYQRGSLIWLRGWPVWVWALVFLAGAAVLAWFLHRRLGPQRASFGRRRASAVWGLQAASLALLLLMLWQPALSISTLKPQQNIVAVVVDDSRSMQLAEDGKTRIERARRLLESSVLPELKKKFPVRLYRAGARLERLAATSALRGEAASTRLGASLVEAAGEAATLPVGAVVLLSDGADNSGGLALETINSLRRTRIPVHTVGFGRLRPRSDVELEDAVLPARALPGSRLSASVTVRAWGRNGAKAKLRVLDGEQALATREITLRGDGDAVNEAISFPAGAAGARAYRLEVQALEGEENTRNNSLTRLVNVEDRKPRVLYFEGEPRWELKFVRRAAEDDTSLRLVTLLRTTQNKFYRQGIDKPDELEAGFPAEVDELFGFEAIVLGAVEAGTFSAAQQQLLKEFVDRRGGGLLFLGGRTSLSDGGWAGSPLAELMPVSLTGGKNTFRREPAKAELTAAGRDNLITRLEDTGDKNAARWRALPALADYQESGPPKPGALVLAELLPSSGGRHPLLATQNYGRGRTALFATGGSWRWQMQQDSKDQTHEIFWRQLLRWLAADTPGRVTLATPKSVWPDEPEISLRVEVRDRNHLAASDATLEAKVLGPGGLADELILRPDPASPGVFTGHYHAGKPGNYLVETVARRGSEELGRDVLTFLRQDGAAEDFRQSQNKELLEQLSRETGGRYFAENSTRDLAEAVSLSDAGLSVRETRDLWDMPAAFLLFAALRAGEWLLRRKWGAV